METKHLAQTYLIAGVVSAILLNAFSSFLGIDVVAGSSMEPTFHDKDVILYDSYNNQQDSLIKRNDVVLFDSGEDGIYIKRVIAIEGDHILIEDGKVYLNGSLLQESYITTDYVEGNVDVVVPPDSLFVMGDNRDVSYDSREFGAIETGAVTGVVLDIFYE